MTFYPAFAEGDDVEIGGVRFPVLRQQRKGSDYLSLSDFIAPRGCEDIAGVFVATAGNMLGRRRHPAEDEGRLYSSLLRQSLADRMRRHTANGCIAR